MCAPYVRITNMKRGLTWDSGVLASTFGINERI